jgi:hypothetical protein
MDKWAYGHSVRLQFIERASPSRTPILNRSTAGCEEECLNGEVFASLNDARRKIGEWHQQYNQKRSHSSLGYLTPESFAASTTNERRLASRLETGQCAGPEAKSCSFLDRPRSMKSSQKNSAWKDKPNLGLH